MTYCNPSDVFTFNGEIVQCVERKEETATLLNMKTLLVTKVDITTSEFQLNVKPVQTIRTIFHGTILPAHIFQTVCEHYEVSEATLLHKYGKREVVDPRHVAQYLCCKFTRCSLKVIAEMFGYKDHTTVIHARDKVKNLLYVRDEIKEHVDAIESLLWMKYNSPYLPASSFSIKRVS